MVSVDVGWDGVYGMFVVTLLLVHALVCMINRRLVIVVGIDEVNGHTQVAAVERITIVLHDTCNCSTCALLRRVVQGRMLRGFVECIGRSQAWLTYPTPKILLPRGCNAEETSIKTEPSALGRYDLWPES